MSQDIPALFQSLASELASHAHDRAIQTCRTLRSSMPDDPDLKKIEVIALINSGQNSAALTTAGSDAALLYERAYAHYKSGQFQEALQLCAQKNEPNFIHLRAQSLFRLGRLEECLEIYEALAKTEGRNETLINLSACSMTPHVSQRVLHHALLQHVTDWEIIFNRSLAYSLTGRFGEASAALDEVKGKLEEIEALDDESWMIKLQKAYLAQVQGNTEEALHIYEGLAETLTDSNAKSIAYHNLAIGKETNESFKKLMSVVEQDFKLTPQQKSHILASQALYQIKKGKLEQADETLNQLQTLSPQAVIALKAYWLIKAKRAEDCEAYLRNVNSVESLSILANLLLQKKKFKEAAEAYSSIANDLAGDPNFNIRYSKLLEDCGEIDQAILHLQRTLERQGPDRSLNRELARLLKKQERFGEALEVHQKYIKQVGGKDVEALAELVIDASNIDLGLAAKLALQLPTVNLKALYANELASLDDILDRLESAPLTKAKIEEKVAEVARKKRKRKPIYPKGFDPKNPHNPKPDPERWLPKRERAAFRKLHKKKTKARGAQGEVPTVQGQEVGTFNRGPSTAHTEAGAAKKHRRKR
mmetsp:Transcript_32709/g.56923  ORF Transcript_32709/g.56923 Transcript_32709/m.56923 type:complete len:590 (-) Transcript_32709:4489-6258(-)